MRTGSCKGVQQRIASGFTAVMRLDFAAAFDKNARFMGGTKPIDPLFARPQYFPADSIATMDEGEPVVEAAGEPAEWEGAPHDKGITCSFEAVGKIWFPKKGVAQKLYKALSNPATHARLLTGVTGSKNVRTLEDADPTILLHAHNLQAGKDFQFLNDMTVRDVGYGVVFVQKSMEDTAAWVAAEDLFPDKRTDLLKDYSGQIQILEIANGTVIVMEFSARMAGVNAPNCNWAADSALMSTAGLPILSWPLSDNAVKQRIESRLRNLHRLAVSPP